MFLYKQAAPALPRVVLSLVLLTLSPEESAKSKPPLQLKRWYTLHTDHLYSPLAAPQRTVAQSVLHVMSLEVAIRRGLANSPRYKIIQNTLELAKMQFNDSWNRLFLPQLSFRLGTTSAYTLTQAKDLEAGAAGYTTRNRGYLAAPAMTLELAQFNLFNSFRDQADFEVARLNWERAQQRQIEEQRAYRNDVTTGYFSLAVAQEKLDAAKRSVEISQSIVDLIRSRIKVQKATPSDLASSNMDLLGAKNTLLAQETATQQALWQLNTHLGDALGTAYTLTSKIQYAPMKLTPQQAEAILLENAPTLRDQRLSVKTSEYALIQAERGRLPLPVVTLNGLSIGYTTSYLGGKPEWGNVGGSGPAGQFDISTSISMTLPIFGQGGFFNQRVVAQAEIALDNVNMQFQQQMMAFRQQLFGMFQQIKQTEENVLNLRQSLSESVQVLEATFSTATQAHATRLELRDAINQARQIEFSLSETVLQHVQAKLTLAATIGVDRLPEDHKEDPKGEQQ